MTCIKFQQGGNPHAVVENSALNRMFGHLVCLWQNCFHAYGSKPYPTMNGDEVKEIVLAKKKMTQSSGCPKEVYDSYNERMFSST